ncbi:MAG: hypothetical protein L3J30_11205 [Marinosulfonomonas sp.]|nr:hypothetical protein [Marinosulfonomonas sp.]
MGNIGMDFHGAKPALIRGGHVLTLLRDEKPDIPFPDMWDFPGFWGIRGKERAAL